MPILIRFTTICGKEENRIPAPEKKKKRWGKFVIFYIETLARLRERKRALAQARALRLNCNTVIRASRSLEPQLYKLGV